MKIEYNKETNTISIGKFSTSKYKHLTFKDWLYEVLCANECTFKVYPRKEYYRSATEVLQCTPSVLYKIFRKLQYKVYVVPYLEYVNKIGFNKGGVDSIMLEKIVKNKEILDQTKEDGLLNIIPFVCQFNKNPSELKTMYGKHWKKIANNSLHRNKYLSLLGVRAGECTDIPTTLLMQKRLCNFHSVELMKHLTLHYKGKWKDTGKNQNVIHLFVDTQRLADILGKVVKPTWTPRRLKEEHDKLAKEVNAKNYSKDVFKSLEKVQVKELLNKSGIRAVLLDNAFDIADEGTCMNHCVGLYAGDVARGTYLVYSIRDMDGSRLSTPGVNIHKDSNPFVRFVFNQHYGKCNSTVTSEDQIELVKNVILKLNKG